MPTPNNDAERCRRPASDASAAAAAASASAGSPHTSLSPQKLAANRANAARSTGPRTPEGKARASENALRHGLTAQASLLRGESRDELDELAHGMHADLRPRGAAEREIVARIVSLTWRLRRVARVEEALWECEDREHALRTGKGCTIDTQGAGTKPTVWFDPRHVGEPGARLAAEQFHSSPRPAIERLALYEQRLDRALHAAFRQLRALRDMREEFADDDDETECAPEAAETGTGSAEPEPVPGGTAPSSGTPRHILQNEATDPVEAAPTPVSERSDDPDSGAG